jgi:hypothetical protein
MELSNNDFQIKINKMSEDNKSIINNELTPRRNSKTSSVSSDIDKDTMSASKTSKDVSINKT